LRLDARRRRLQCLKKTLGIVDAFDELIDKARPCFSQARVFDKAKELATGSLLTLGKRTVTGVISAGGRQFYDWSSAYRLFEKERIDLKGLFGPVIDRTIECRQAKDALYVMMDDTLIRKRGKKVPGAAWRRDPLGPPFTTNFVWGQRYLQISAALPDRETKGRARGIPIGFYHAPSPVRPKADAPAGEWECYREQQKATNLSACGARHLQELRERVTDKRIVCAVDGSFTNATVFRSLPKDTTIIGRIRKDARLFEVPDAKGCGCGRKRYYGTGLPTPEQIRQDDSIPWEKVTAFAAGKHHEFSVKALSPVRWKASGSRDVLLVVIRPIGYRPNKNSRVLYRQPAYLLCTDVDMPIEEVVQAYLWRWEIELNFRDEKTVMGVGEAQVRHICAVEAVPAFLVAVYSYLLLAACSDDIDPGHLPPPKWYPEERTERITTQKALALFRSQYWGISMECDKTHFMSPSPGTRTRFFDTPFSKPAAPSPNSAICYAMK